MIARVQSLGSARADIAKETGDTGQGLKGMARLNALAAAFATTLLTACSPVAILNATIPQGGVTVERGISYDEDPRRQLDVYRGKASGTPLPLVVFIYGGSWRTGDRSIYGFVGTPLAALGAVVVVPDYRLYPEVSFPDFLHDNARAVAWAVAHAKELGADPRRVFVMGHSAGAFNAAMLATDPRLLAGAGLDRGAIAGVIGLAGPYAFLPTTDPSVIPVFGPANTPANQPAGHVDGRNPPLLLLAGDSDSTVRPANTRVLAAKVAEAGGSVESRIYPDVGHIGIITAFAPLFSGRAPVLDDVWRFITQQRPAGAAPGL